MQNNYSDDLRSIIEYARAAATVISLAQHFTDDEKLFEFLRYKLVILVILGHGQDQGQNLPLLSHCLWNSYSDTTYEMLTYFVVVLVHATYFE